jgi:hypothetical protein
MSEIQNTEPTEQDTSAAVEGTPAMGERQLDRGIPENTSVIAAAVSGVQRVGLSAELLSAADAATERAGAIEPLSAEVREFIRASKAKSTLRGYQSDWLEFCTWTSWQGIPALPAAAETVARYIAACASCLKPGSIQRRLNAIAEAHKAAGLETPTAG